MSDFLKKDLEEIYKELLKRPIDDNALNYYLNLLESKKLTIQEITDTIKKSKEYVKYHQNDKIVNDFHRLFYGKRETLPIWSKTQWHGI